MLDMSIGCIGDTDADEALKLMVNGMLKVGFGGFCPPEGFEPRCADALC